MDRLSPERRSWLMSRVSSKNTSAELRVRKAAHALGLRFRLHRKDLAGTPDLVFPRHCVALFVHGCFWHRHANCKKATSPKTHKAYWRKKFDHNVKHDEAVFSELRTLGWRPEVIWECETKSGDMLARRFSDIFEAPAKHRTQQ